jgi:hypothetical protein
MECLPNRIHFIKKYGKHLGPIKGLPIVFSNQPIVGRLFQKSFL